MKLHPLTPIEIKMNEESRAFLARQKPVTLEQARAMTPAHLRYDPTSPGTKKPAGAKN